MKGASADADDSAPRAASIVSTTRCVLWALDRVSFRTILLDVSLVILGICCWGVFGVEAR